jgi:tripartite-type tricarboxylate transporter receptor subunit TctC
VPTLPEFGIDVAAAALYGVAGPKGMDDTVVKTLHDAFKKGMAESMSVAVLQRPEQEPIYQSTEDYRSYIRRELVAQKRTVEELGLNRNDGG